MMNPQLPKMYSLVKLHKPGYPIKAEVSYVTAASLKISRILIDFIKETWNFLNSIYYRYIDDIIACYNGTKGQLNI